MSSPFLSLVGKSAKEDTKGQGEEDEYEELFSPSLFLIFGQSKNKKGKGTKHV
ncbi:hypothetical protein [Escherichia coli]|uniref:hypothetical protein n=1 Tax=Escherichia coli TaxID=562 RepID=UPI0032DB6952